MSDPERLLTDGTDFERAMLEAWNDERPTVAARDRALAIVVAGSAVGAGVIAGVSAAAPHAAVRGGAWIAKWILVSVLAVATTAGTIALLRHASSHSTVPTTTTPTAAPVPAPPPSSIDSAPLRVDAPNAISIARPESASPETPPARVPAPRQSGPHAARKNDPPAANAASLNAQIASLDRARRAIEANDPASALHRLDEYRASFPEGTLAQEADLLRIEALLASGQRASAELLGARFMAAHPGSPHARRIRELLSTSQP